MMNILVPVDFSACSINAYQFAIDLAMEKNASITIFHASHHLTSATANMMIRVDDIVMEEAEKRLEELQGKSYLNIPINHITSIGLANDEIKKLVETQKFDLIIMGTTGSSNLEDKLIGTITSNLIKKVNTPILVVPKKAKYDASKPLLVNVDIQDKKQLNFAPLKAILTPNSKLKVFYVSKQNLNNEDITEHNIHYLEKELDGYSHDYLFKHNHHILTAIHDELNNTAYNLVVTFNKKYAFIEGLFHKSISKNLALHAKTPLLIIK